MYDVVMETADIYVIQGFKIIHFVVLDCSKCFIDTNNAQIFPNLFLFNFLN